MNFKELKISYERNADFMHIHPAGKKMHIKLPASPF